MLGPMEEGPKGIFGGRIGMLGDVRRLVELGDVIYYVGNLLYRRSLRYTLFTAGIGILGYATQMAGVAGFTARQAIALPLLVGGASLFGGLTLKLIPTLLASRRMVQAQAGDLNLMEDYRKSRQEEHLEFLWQRVFAHEPEPTDRMGQVSGDAIGRDRFLRLARYALKSPLPQMRQRYQVGLDLRYFEDWRDGAFFDRTDNKLGQQFDGDRVLEGVRRQAPVPFRLKLQRSLGKLPQYLWFSLTMRAVSLAVADALDKLNRHYRTDMFNSQVLLWPGEEEQDWPEEMAEAKKRILVGRKRLLTRAFGPQRSRAAHMVIRLFQPDLLSATHLRLHYDPQYHCGRLGQDYQRDLREAFVPARTLSKLEKRLAPVRERFEEIRTWLDNRNWEEAKATGEDRRAIDIALLTAPAKLIGKILAEKEDDTGAAAKQLRARLAEALATSDVHNHRLVCLRLHHELTRLQIREYLELIETLHRSCEPASDAGA